MNEHIDRVKKWIPEWCDKIAEFYHKHNMKIDGFRTRIITFGDYRLQHEAAIQVTDFFDFKHKREKFLSVLNSVKILPGAVTSVAGMEALSYAIHSDWNDGLNKRQYIIVFSNSPINDIDDPEIVSFHMKGIPASKVDFLVRKDRLCPIGIFWLMVPYTEGWRYVIDNVSNTVAYPSEAGKGLEENKYDYDTFFSDIPLGFE